MDEETFAPILYVRRFPADDIDAAIAVQNQVEQGLSSAIHHGSWPTGRP
jgi:acyl-CoA reductase-like NAD-dependent aldehyde dehydrogenase